MSFFDKLLWRSFFDRKVTRTAFRRPRASPRISIEERAEIRRPPDNAPDQVIIADMSSGGARLSTPLKLAAGDELTLVVNTGRFKTLTLGCEVVVARPRTPGRVHTDYGVKFTAVHPGDLDRIRDFVTSRDGARRGPATIR